MDLLIGLDVGTSAVKGVLVSAEGVRLAEEPAAKYELFNDAAAASPAESPLWPRIVAELCGLELCLLAGQTAQAVSAAMLAAIGAGLHPGEREAFAAMGGRAVVIRPEPAVVREYEEIYAT